MVSIVREMSLFEKFISGVDAYLKTKHFGERCFVHFETKKKKLKI